MSDQIERHDPFHDFINFNLNMEGVDGVSFETVALAMREVIKTLPAERYGDMWGDRLDALQTVLRASLTIEVISRLLEANPELQKIDQPELEMIVNLSISLAYITYNNLAERLDFENEAMKKSRNETAKLWVALRGAAGWVSKAASEGDAVARRMSHDITGLLEQIRPRDWNNNTKTLRRR
jgi:hypothetical protein